MNSATIKTDEIALDPVPVGATPLWAAATKAENLRLVTFLLNRGAVLTLQPEVNLKLSDKAVTLISKAQEDIDKGLIVIQGHSEPTSSFKILPKEIIQIIVTLHWQTD